MCNNQNSEILVSGGDSCFNTFGFCNRKQDTGNEIKDLILDNSDQNDTDLTAQFIFSGMDFKTPDNIQNFVLLLEKYIDRLDYPFKVVHLNIEKYCVIADLKLVDSRMKYMRDFYVNMYSKFIVNFPLNIKIIRNTP